MGRTIRWTLAILCAAVALPQLVLVIANLSDESLTPQGSDVAAAGAQRIASTPPRLVPEFIP